VSLTIAAVAALEVIDSGQLQTQGSLDAKPRREMLFLAIASVLATIPVWIASYPPMVDLPQHAAQVAMLRNLHDPSFSFGGLFQINWFTPYLFGYMAIYALTPLLGIVAACKLVISAALAGLPVSTSLLMKETGADRKWALLTIPAMYGFAYGWGFLNFLVAAPVGLIFLAFVMRHVRKPNWVTSVWLAIFAVLLFFCHALICGFFGLIACAFILAEAGAIRKAFVAMMPMASVLPFVMIWYLRTKSHPSAQAPIVWDLGWVHSVYPTSLGGRASGFFRRMLGLRANRICITVGASFFAIPLLAGARPAKRLAVWIPFAVCLIVLLFLPTTVMGTSFVYERFTVFALPFFLLGMIPAKTGHPAWRRVAVFLIIVWVAIIAARTVRYDSEARDFNQILSKMDSNQRAMSLIFNQGTDPSPFPIFLHFPAWYSGTKGGVVDFSFAQFYPELVVYKPSRAPVVRNPYEFEPERFTWEWTKGAGYRYFVVRSPVDVGEFLSHGAPCRVTLAAHSNLWWLYEIDSHCS
jgi:hypothetical protein